MTELFGIVCLLFFAGVLAASYRELSSEERLEARISAALQAEGLHNLRVNLFIFLIAALVRSNWAAAGGCALAFGATFLWLPQATQVQGGTAQSEWGFYLAFALVVPPRLAAISLSSGTANELLVQIAATCIAIAILLSFIPARGAILQKMRSVLAPWHNAVCVCFLVVVTPIVGQTTLSGMHLFAGCMLLSIAGIRASNAIVAKRQLAFFLHWPLPLAGGRLPVAILVLGGTFSLKAAVILGVSLLTWSWVMGFHKSQLLAQRSRMIGRK